MGMTTAYKVFCMKAELIYNSPTGIFWYNITWISSILYSFANSIWVVPCSF